MAEREDGRRERRQRGVRADRARLDAALAASGLPRKTQAALADRIADIEGLDNPPRDLVGRVFREQPVDAQSIARVAAALGVPATSLTADAVDAPTGGRAAAGPLNRRFIPWIAAAAVLLGLVAVGAAAASHAPTRCTISTALFPAKGGAERLGLVIARFEGDPANQVQTDLVRAFSADPALSRALDVIRDCRVYREPGFGNVSQRLRDVRTRARRSLRSANGQVLIWGRVENGRARLRFVTPDDMDAPVRTEVDGKIIALDQSFIEIAIGVSRDIAPSSDVKRLTLQLMAPSDPDLVAMRDAALEVYDQSTDWLRNSISADLSLLRMLDPKLHPSRWAAAMNQICVNQRTLAEYEADRDGLERALATCDRALEEGEGLLSPDDTAELLLNGAVAMLRSDVFSASQEERLAVLTRAQERMLQADALVVRTADRQLRARVLRTLGGILLTRAELTPGDAGDALFEEAFKITEAALGLLTPEAAPVEWALSENNMCFGKTRQGYRRGIDGGAPYIDAAVEHCERAARTLSPRANPFDWSMVNNNLANAYAYRAAVRGDTDSFEAASGALKDAQSVYMVGKFPGRWAELEYNIGELACFLGVKREDPQYFTQALEHAAGAREVFASLGASAYLQMTNSLTERAHACVANGVADCPCR